MVPPKRPAARSDGRHDETRLIRAGQARANPPRTVGPPIQKGSTVLLPDAASLCLEGVRELRAVIEDRVSSLPI